MKVKRKIKIFFMLRKGLRPLGKSQNSTIVAASGNLFLFVAFVKALIGKGLRVFVADCRYFLFYFLFFCCENLVFFNNSGN